MRFILFFTDSIVMRKNSQQFSDKNTNKKKGNNEEHNANNTVRHKKFWKFWLTIVLMNLVLLVVVIRLLYIQVVNSDYYVEQAKKQHQSRVELAPERGNIYDRNGNLLASNISSISIAVDPTVLKNKDTISFLIEKHIGISQKKVLDKINSAKGAFVWICRRVLPDKVSELKKIKDRGLIFIEEPIRYYNYSSVGAQLIGCTNIDNHGLGGIELQYDKILRGESGYMLMYKDAKGRLRPAINLPTIPPKNGENLYLTLDIELQKIVEFELMQGVVGMQAASGTAIAIDPSTGEILASASYPGYNPNSLSSYSMESMRNRAVTDAYEPGSTFKAITAAAGIEEKLVNPNSLYNGYQGQYIFEDVVIRDDHPLGVVKFYEAFSYSSNIVMSQLAAKLPDQKFYKYIRDFGFGLTTGVDIPGELTGRIPKFTVMNPVDKRFFGFGYGILVTPIQLVSAYASIANGGALMKPYIVNRITIGENTIKEFKPQKVRKTISEETSKTLTELLCRVVENGTGKRAFIPDLKIAGKTGTSQKMVSGSYSKSNYFASFVGYFPAESPKICLLVVIDSPKNSYYGGSVAAPIFRNIALRWASISPSSLVSKTDNKKADLASNQNYVFIPEFSGVTVTEAKMIASDLGLVVDMKETDGLIVGQMPRAGTRVKRGTKIMLKAKINKNTEVDANTYITEETLPNVTGLSLRRAISILNNAGVKAKIIGNGKVKSQRWEIDENKERICVLTCY